MLSPTEAAARNRKVAMQLAEKTLAKLEECPAPIAKRKPATRSAIPQIEPSKRTWNRPPHVAKVRTSGKVRIPISTPSPVVRDTQVNGITSFHQVKRVPQYAIDVVKVARYLAK